MNEKKLPKGPYRLIESRLLYPIVDARGNGIGSAFNEATARLFRESFTMKVFLEELMQNGDLPEYRKRQARKILNDITK